MAKLHGGILWLCLIPAQSAMLSAKGTYTSYLPIPTLNDLPFRGTC